MPPPSRTELVLVALVLVATVFAAWVQAQEPSRNPVFVYIANETRPGDYGRVNYATILGWLQSSTDEVVLAAAEAIQRDQEEYPAVIDREVRDMSAANFPIVVATNASVRAGHIRYREEGGTLTRIDLAERTSSGNYILDESPLATKEALRIVLDAACQRFDPAGHSFVIVLKSHGLAPFVAIPRLCLRHEELDRERVIQIAAGDASEPGPALFGVTRGELHDLLCELDRDHGMRVQLLVLEACGTAVQPGDVPPNVDLVIGADGEVGYENFDYRALLASPSIVDEFISQASSRNAFFEIRGERPRVIRYWAWLPLLLVGVVVLRAWRRERRARVHGSPVGAP